MLLAVALTVKPVTSANACLATVGAAPALTEVVKRWSQAGGGIAGTVLRDGVALPGRPSCGETASLDLQLEIEGALRAGGIVLLGEVHDNGEHHALRAALLAAPIRSRFGEIVIPPKPALVFEHIRMDQLPALQKFAQVTRGGRGINPAETLMGMLEWDKSGWPAAKLFEPLFAAAIALDLPVAPGDPPRALARRVAKEGADALPAADKSLLAEGLPAPEQEALLDELAASHCGLVPKTAFGGMATAQRYRDAHLAKQTAMAAQKAGAAVLLAGNGHVRNDRGVPWHLRRMAPARKVVSVMLVEVEDGQTDPAAYVPRTPDGKPAADYVVLTPRQTREDPCIAMRQRMGAPQKK